MKLLDFETREEIKEVDFGVVEAGKVKSVKLVLKNDTDAELSQIKIVANDSEVKIESVPKIVNPQSEALVVVSYAPDIDIKKGLKTILNVSGQEIYRA